MISFLAYGMAFFIALAITALIGFGKLCGYIYNEIEKRNEYKKFRERHPELTDEECDIDDVDWILRSLEDDKIDRDPRYREFCRRFPELSGKGRICEDWQKLLNIEERLDELIPGRKERYRKEETPKQVKCTNRYQEFQRRFPKFTGKYWSESEGNWEEVLKHAEMMDIIESSQRTK